MEPSVLSLAIFLAFSSGFPGGWVLLSNNFPAPAALPTALLVISISALAILSSSPMPRRFQGAYVLTLLGLPAFAFAAISLLLFRLGPAAGVGFLLISLMTTASLLLLGYRREAV
jgi:hypothetical protein